MKKWIAIFAIAILIVITVVLYQYNLYKNETLRIQKLNQEYEDFTQGEILGTSLITLINKSIDLNNKNNVQLDENKSYIENDTNSIKIDVKFLESDSTYSMERISNLGSEQFTKNYATSTFKCTLKTYHEKTKSIKYLLFEQI